MFRQWRSLGRCRWPALTYRSAYTVMRGKGLCDVSDASTLDGVRVAARLLGCTLSAYRSYEEPWSNWRGFFLRHVGTDFVVMQTANGQALQDAISSQGENATNLQDHFIGVVGHFDGGVSPYAQRMRNARCPLDGAVWTATAWRCVCPRRKSTKCAHFWRPFGLARTLRSPSSVASYHRCLPQRSVRFPCFTDISAAATPGPPWHAW